MKLIQPITLKIDSELWKKFKDYTPRTIKLNDAVVALIKKEVDDFSNAKKVGFKDEKS